MTSAAAASAGASAETGLVAARRPSARPASATMGPDRVRRAQRAAAIVDVSSSAAAPWAIVSAVW